MSILSRARIDYYKHLFAERRADLARALAPAAKTVATQAFRASLAELFNEIAQTAQESPQIHQYAAITLAIDLTTAELDAHMSGAMDILMALDGSRYYLADFPASPHDKRAAS